MFAGQVNWTDPTGAAGQRILQDNFASGNESEGAFALVYEALLGLSGEQCSETPASNNWLDNDTEDGLIEKFKSTGFPSATDLASGRGELNPGYPGAQFSGSSMGRLVSRGMVSGVEPLPSRWADPRAPQNGTSDQVAGRDGNFALPTNSSGAFNKSELSNWMDGHALSRSSHHCAMYCRLGMEAAGLNTGDRPQSGDAGDYGPFLLRHGAQTVSQDSYAPQVGDVVVFNKTDRHPNGHIEMYDGHQWVSDFMQHSFSPYRDADSTPSFTIYRFA